MSRLALAALTAALAFPAPAVAAVPAGTDWTEHYIETPGHPRLHADLLLPQDKAGQKIPIIVSVGPYFAHSGQTTPTTPTNDGPQLRWNDLIQQGRLFERGYGLLQVDLRGFGASSGCNDFGGSGEQADVERAVEWAARQPWSTGKVAIYGKSYDGWTGVMALDSKPEGLAAAVIQSPIIDGYRALYQDGLHYGPNWWYTPALYQTIDLFPPTPYDLQRTEYVKGFATGTEPACYAQNIAFQNATHDHDTPFWRERDLDEARGDDTPTFWSHGFIDGNTKPTNFEPVWSTLQGPKRAWFGQFAHTRPNESGVGRHSFYWDELFRFLGEHVEGQEAASAGDPPVEVESNLGEWRSEEQWPPADGRGFSLSLRPGTYVDAPNNDAGEVRTAQGGQVVAAGAGQGIWSISDPLPHRAHIAGVGAAEVTVEPVAARTTLIALLYDYDPATGRATLISRGGKAITDGGVGPQRIEMYPQDWVLEPGHRLAALVTGADVLHYTPTHSGLPVDVTGGRITMPFLTYERTADLEGEPSRDANTRDRVTISDATVTSARAEFEVPPALQQR